MVLWWRGWRVGVIREGRPDVVAPDRLTDVLWRGVQPEIWWDGLRAAGVLRAGIVGWIGDRGVRRVAMGSWLEAAGWDGIGVRPVRSGYLNDVVDDVDVPVAGVQVDVVSLAEQDQVRDARRASVDPMHQVVGFALNGWSAADHAAAVASVQREPHRCGDETFGGTDVQWLGLAAEDDGDDLSVAGEATYGGRREIVAEDGLADRAGGRGFEGVEVDGDGQVRLRTVPGNVAAERLVTRPAVSRLVVSRRVVTGGTVDLWPVVAGAVGEGGGVGGAVDGAR